jgi:FKBP-type peptidyl-prolyl cis-trans isomerase
MRTPCPAELALALVVLALAGCENKVPEPTPEPRKATTAQPETPEPADLIKEDLVIGTGAEAKDGDKVKVHYTGRLQKTNFTFDTSVGKQPFEFEVGKGAVIKGWDLGVVGMKIGGKRKLTIPSRLGYGDTGSPPKIPPKATLVFEVELLSVGDHAADAGTDAAADAGPKGAKKDDKAKKGDARP